MSIEALTDAVRSLEENYPRLFEILPAGSQKAEREEGGTREKPHSQPPIDLHVSGLIEQVERVARFTSSRCGHLPQFHLTHPMGETSPRTLRDLEIARSEAHNLHPDDVGVCADALTKVAGKVRRAIEREPAMHRVATKCPSCGCFSLRRRSGEAFVTCTNPEDRDGDQRRVWDVSEFAA